MENLEARVSNIMTKDIVSVGVNTSMLDIDKIFTEKDFHYLPVLDEDKNPVGIVSKSDYCILLDHLTLKKIGNYERSNRMYFRSLLAEEIMTKNPTCLNIDSPIRDAVDLFIKNKQRSVLITNDQNVCVGICTPIDILKWIKVLDMKLSQQSV